MRETLSILFFWKGREDNGHRRAIQEIHLYCVVVKVEASSELLIILMLSLLPLKTLACKREARGLGNNLKSTPDSLGSN